MLLYILDLIGSFAFVITGAYKAKMTKFTIFGAVFFGIITAIGGGTTRDLIIGRTPLFYISDKNYLIVAIIGSVATFYSPTFFKQKYSFFRFIDSIGVAAFSIIGVFVTYNHVFSGASPNITNFLACVLLGMFTAFGGGVLRDAIMGDKPFAFRSGSNYALSSFLGALSFYVIMFYNVNIAIVVSLLVTIIMREVVSKYGVYKKVLKKS